MTAAKKLSKLGGTDRRHFTKFQNRRASRVRDEKLEEDVLKEEIVAVKKVVNL